MGDRCLTIIILKFPRKKLVDELIVFSPQPIQSVPQEGSRVEVPRPATLVYEKHVLKIVQRGVVLRTFTGVVRLFFSTWFNGTRTFFSTAAVPVDEIFGGGMNYRYS